jgi:hypothetical protein
VTVAQGKRNLVYTDGTTVQDAFNDFESIALTGTPTAPTAAAGTNTTQLATTAFVQAAKPTIENVLTSTSTTNALSAAQGKALNDAKAPLVSPALTGTPTAPTATDGTNTTQLATTAFVQNAVGGYLAKTMTSADVTLTDAEASNPIIKVSGTLTANVNLILPVTAKRIYAVWNATSGAFTLTVKTPAGAGVTVAQGKRNLVYTDGTTVQDAFNDFESIALTGTPTAPTAAAGTATTQLATTAFVQAALALIDGGTA